MNVDYVKYDSLGQIISHGTIDSLILAEKILAEELMLEGTGDPATHYVALPSKVITAKAENPVTCTGNVLSNIPANSWLYLEGECYPATDTTITLDLSVPGTYQVKVVSVAYLTKIVGVVQS